MNTTSKPKRETWSALEKRYYTVTPIVIKNALGQRVPGEYYNIEPHGSVGPISIRKDELEANFTRESE